VAICGQILKNSNHYPRAEQLDSLAPWVLCLAYDCLELRCKLTPEKPSLKALEIAHIIDLPMTSGLSQNEARLKVAKDLG
jgi:hypothetical protein